ncbi:MAG: hypothetical protein KDK54_06345 [Leptospiraceae bacterium]|nr:hypothetical protein [Leptospiraceae bacterium]
MDMKTINSLSLPYEQKIDETLVTSGQPGVEHLALLKENGFTGVLNISPESTRNYLPSEGEIVSSNGLDYIHFPIDCSVLSKEQYEEFRERLNSLRKDSGKVLVHCGMNIKSSGFVHIYRILELNQDEDFALSEFFKTPEHEPKWFPYFASFGLKVQN